MAYFIACPITSHLGKITSSLVSLPPLFFNITPLICPLLIFLPVFPSLHLLLLLHLHHTHVTHVTHTSRISKYLSESHSQISRSRPGCNNILYNDENIPPHTIEPACVNVVPLLLRNSPFMAYLCKYLAVAISL